MEKVKISLIGMDTVSYNDVSFKDIEVLGETNFAYPRTPNETIEACKDADIVLLNKIVMDEYVISHLPKLKFIGVFATGYNNIDLVACKKYGVLCSNAPDYSTTAVAQHTMGFLLSFMGSLSQYARSVNNGDWIRSREFSYYTYPMSEVYGKTLGIFGFGHIGKRVATLAQAFGMKVIFHNRSTVKDTSYEQVTAERLFAESDVVSLHCPLTEQTKEIINEKTLSMMKPTALLINTARGGLVNEADLATALKSGKLAGACLDVVAKEPMLANNPLYGIPNCVITPHIAWLPVETRQKLEEVVANNVKAFLEGNPKNIVNE